jgi:hypothetical protein
VQPLGILESDEELPRLSRIVPVALQFGDTPALPLYMLGTTSYVRFR